MTDWKPLYDKIIVRRHPVVEKVKGIDVPDVAKEDQNTGTVVEVGDGRIVSGSFGSTYPLRLRVDYEVLFNKFAGVPLEGGDPDLVILREDEVLAFREP